MDLKVPFGCANCIQGPAWGENSGQYNAVKIDIHQPEVKTNEQIVDKKLYEYPSASVYDTNAQNKASITPPFEVKPKENTTTNDQTPIYFAEGDSIDNEQNLNKNFKTHNPLNHQNVDKQKLAFGANEKVKQTNKTSQNSKLPETNNDAEPIFNTDEVVKTLNSKDLKEQTIGLATIAFICEENPKIAKQFLNPPIVKALTDILKQDSKKLSGPTPQQLKLRKEVMEGKKISDEQMKIASQSSPMEMSERNKQFAIYTIALLDGILINEFDKNNKTSSEKIDLEMRDLPGMDDVINVLKTDPNPVLRTTAVEALFFIAKPQFNPVIKPILKAASNDKDIKVSETAKKALANIDKKGQNIQQKQLQQNQKIKTK